MRPLTRRNSLRFKMCSMAMCWSGLANAGEPRPGPSPATGASPQLEDRYPVRRVAFAHGVTGLADVTYSTASGFRPLTLDLYLPRTSALVPAIIYVHGGGWMGGHARHAGAFENWPQVLASVAARGYVVASVNYRLSGEAESPAAAHDIINAVRWLRASATRHSIDKQRIGIWGVSAGGQLAALVGTACDVPALTPPGTESACVQAVATWYAIFDFGSLVANASPASPEARYLGCESGVCPEEKIALASAIRYTDRSDPPFLLVHGLRDRTVPASQSRVFHAALQAQGARSELLLIDDVDHSFIGATPKATRNASLRALRATEAFFDRVLKRPGSSRLATSNAP